MPADVVILGAGPVGCTLALLLERDGKSAALVQARKDDAARYKRLWGEKA